MCVILMTVGTTQLKYSQSTEFTYITTQEALGS